MAHATLSKLVAATATTFGMPGLAVGVWVNAQATFACHGITNVDHPLPIDPNTLFALGSVTNADYLEQLQDLGVCQRGLRLERDLWILMQAVAPQDAAAWLADKRNALGDAEFCALYLEHDAAFDWAADDARLCALAERIQRWIVNRHDSIEVGAWSTEAQAIGQLITTSDSVSSPGWERLTELMQERTERR